MRSWNAKNTCSTKKTLDLTALARAGGGPLQETYVNKIEVDDLGDELEEYEEELEHLERGTHSAHSALQLSQAPHIMNAPRRSTQHLTLS
eukprot:996969-Prorocentrum_minimum.AAC.2